MVYSINRAKINHKKTLHVVSKPLVMVDKKILIAKSEECTLLAFCNIYRRPFFSVGGSAFKIVVLASLRGIEWET